MVVVLTPRDQEFLERGNSTIVAMDQSKVKNKTIEDDSSKQYKASKQRQGHRWAVFKLSQPDASLDCVKNLGDFMLFVGAGMEGRKGDDYYFK
ncbi:hypothetical protein BGZ57DRAFT_934599 [Hyaloscypha finlandica]|nr:hypothetical protein BGZ57DRAFT_934599 [Hyaloscypha finlandica]